ncbi:hypothetical protein pb186bvf_006823 [Paramecium bursaria]
MKKRNQKLCDLPTLAKVQCAKFGTYTKSLFASGDDRNNVQIWDLTSLKTLTTFSQPNSQTECTAVQFNFIESELFSGSNRGIINVWDIASQKQSQTLKGHTASINSMAIYQSQEHKNLLVSGAYDTIIKLWDLKQRQPIASFKGHSMQINALAISPDHKMLASGSQDGMVKIWDIGTQRIMANLNQHDSFISCLQYNPVDRAIASGGGDRCVRYWDLEQYQAICATRTDTTPIQQIQFVNEGKYLFSAAHESLKVWDMEKDGGQLLDNIESTWRGVQDMITDRDYLYGLAASVQGFFLYGVNLKTVNFEAKPIEPQRSSGGRQGVGGVRGRTPDQRQSNQSNSSNSSNPINQVNPVNQVNQITNIPNPQLEKKMLNKFQNNAQSILNQEYNYNLSETNFQPAQNFNTYGQNVYQQSPPSPSKAQALLFQQQNLQQFQQIPQNQPQQIFQPIYQINQAPQLIVNQQQMMVPQIQKQYPVSIDYPHQQPKFLPAQQIQALNQFDSIPQQIEEEAKMEPPSSEQSYLYNDQVNLSSFIIDQDPDVYKQTDKINEIQKDHTKAIQILEQRMNYMKPINHWWTQNNVKSAVNAINQLNEPSILLDAFTLILNSNKFSQITIDLVPNLMEKAKILIESKYLSHIKGGLEFVYRILVTYREEILSIKQFNQMSKVDLAREERVAKCDKVIDQLKIIVQMPKIQKIIDRNKEEVSQLAKKIQIETIPFLKKVVQNQMY